MCFFICFILVLYVLIISCLLFVFCSLIFVKLVFRIIVLHSKCIASHGKLLKGSFYINYLVILINLPR
jgi:hypothetical protein